MIVSQVSTLRYILPRRGNDCKSSQYPQVYTTQEGKMIVSQVSTLRYYTTQEGKMIVSQVSTLRYILPRRGK